MLVTPERQFKGNKDDGSYLDWRTSVIENIHRQPLSIMDKIHLLSTTVKQNKENLRQIFNAGTYTPKAYRRIIESLENHYGGDNRAYSFLRDQMISMPGFDLKDLNSVTLIRTKVEKFMEYVDVHQLGHFARADNKTLLELVLSNVLTKHQILQFRKTCMFLGIHDMHSLPALADWLKHEEGLLQWAEQNHNPHLMGSHKKTKATVHKVTAGEVSDDDEKSVSRNMAALLAKAKTNDRATRLALMMNEELSKASDWAEEVEDDNVSQGVDDQSFDTASDDGDNELPGDAPTSDLALAVLGSKPPTCAFCKKGRHYVSKCEEFRQVPVSARYDFCKENKRCGNCLSPRHDTRKCPSTYRCQECGKKHHTLLHYKNVPGQQPAKKPG